MFYELGLADSLGKEMFLLTQDEAEEVPVDVRHRELITYSLDDEKSLLDKLHTALSEVLFERYKSLYHLGRKVLKEFNKEVKANHQPVSEKNFQLQVVQQERTQGIPSEDDEDALRGVCIAANYGNSSRRPRCHEEHSNLAGAEVDRCYWLRVALLPCCLGPTRRRSTRRYERRNATALMSRTERPHSSIRTNSLRADPSPPAQPEYQQQKNSPPE